MTSEGFGEMFEGDSADTWAGKIPRVSMGAERRVSRAQTRERGPPSALAEFYFLFCYETKTTREMKTTFGTHDQTSYIFNR